MTASSDNPTQEKFIISTLGIGNNPAYRQWLDKQKQERGLETASDEEFYTAMIAEKQTEQQREYERQKFERGLVDASNDELLRILAQERNREALEGQKRVRGMDGASDEDLAWRILQERTAVQEIRKIRQLKNMKATKSYLWRSDVVLNGERKKISVEADTMVLAKSLIELEYGQTVFHVERGDLTQWNLASLRLRLKTGNKLILILEDNDLNERIFRDVLMTHFQCLTMVAQDGDKAVRLAFEHRPDLIITDNQHPGLSGLEVGRLLKQDHRTRHMPMICLTAFAMKGDAERIIEAGFDVYMPKPIIISALLRVVKSLLPEMAEYN